jgi:peptide/nickel transport system substrate-binding protein
VRFLRFPGLLAGLLLGTGGVQAASPPDVLVVVQSLDDIVSLDPGEGFELSGVQAFTSLYQRLVEPDPDVRGVLHPALASGWAAGPAGRSLVFEVRPDARFASGRPVRPEDVIFSLVRAVRMNRSPASILNELGWHPDTIEQQLRRVDAHHVEVRWSVDVGPAFALAILSSPVASVVDATEVRSHEVAGDSGNLWLRSHSAGSGSFRMRRYIPHEALVLDANPLTPGEVPHIKTLVLRNIADAAVRRLLVEVGDADIARDLGPDELAALEGHRHLKVLAFPSAALHYLLLNTENRASPALANPAFWEAARWLVDYDGIARQLLKGSYAVHQAFLPEGLPGALTAQPYHLDVAKARQILAQAGLHEVSFELDVFNQPPYGDIAQSLQATFAAAGVHIEIRPMLAAELYWRIRHHAEAAAWLYWIPDYSDPNSNAAAFASNPEDGTSTLAWRAGWHIPALSVRTAAARASADPAARARLYGELQEEVQRSSPFVICFQERSRVVVRDNVHGYRQGLNSDMVYYARVTK